MMCSRNDVAQARRELTSTVGMLEKAPTGEDWGGLGLRHLLEEGEVGSGDGAISKRLEPVEKAKGAEGAQRSETSRVDGRANHYLRKQTDPRDLATGEGAQETTQAQWASPSTTTPATVSRHIHRQVAGYVTLSASMGLSVEHTSEGIKGSSQPRRAVRMAQMSWATSSWIMNSVAPPPRTRSLYASIPLPPDDENRGLEVYSAQRRAPIFLHNGTSLNPRSTTDPTPKLPPTRPPSRLPSCLSPPRKLDQSSPFPPKPTNWAQDREALANIHSVGSLRARKSIESGKGQGLWSYNNTASAKPKRQRQFP
ncbi:hypothetical protein FPV67DRAFT_1762499 [Lyophyllum atratum]|nr:hypothetical protein FPV67DRAFT_1762499 [Lyophyllum atratum]